MAVDGGLTASSPVSAKAGSGGGCRACGGCDCVYLWKRIWLLLKNTAQMLLKNRGSDLIKLLLIKHNRFLF
jgi:hypothetical protein